ncbi:MAG: prephenate dehydrogenase/arogenate dehydrogenase family protein, partial [Mycobacteriales bacterium]
MTDAVLIVGTGLIGTSMGLALRGRREVLLTDRSPEHLEAAVARGAGRAWDGVEPAGLVVLAVPPAVLSRTYREIIGVFRDAVVTHVCSIQSQVLLSLRDIGADEALLCGGHPLAGRETSGPAS